MTVNMIILLLLYYLIHLYYIFFNNFLLTRQRLETALFSHLSSSCENTNSFLFPLLHRAHDFVKKFIRIANNTNPSHFVLFFDQD